jgi:hypothetical protein
VTGLDFERALAIGLVAVYWLDSLRFLKPHDVAIELIDQRRWHVRFGAIGFELAGCRPAVPAFFRPDRPVLVTRWQLTDAGDQSDAPATTMRHDDVWLGRAARVLGGLCLTALLLVVIASPLALLLGYGAIFLVLCAASYVIALLAGVLLTSRARQFGMKRSAAFGLALIAVVCLPCAPNLLRAASASAPFRKVVLPDFARAGADDAAWADFRRPFERALAAELASRDPSSSAARDARAMLERIRDARI